jgi:hypothetical protein
LQYGQAPKLKPETSSKIAADLKDLRTAWPAALPPDVPTKTPEAVTQLVKGIEAAAQKAAM